MDPVALVQDSLQRARDAIQGVTDLKTTLRQRYGDYSSVIEPLKSKPDVIATTEIGRELRRLTELFTRVAGLLGKYTAAPADGRLTKFNLKAKRAADWEDVSKELDEIDADVMRQLAIMNLKGAISTSEMKVLQGVDEKVDRLTYLVNEMRPPSLPDMAKVPQRAPDLPPAFVERSELVGSVTKVLAATNRAADKAHVLRGIPGGGKTVAASSVVRCDEVRRSFKDGIFWVQVGQVGTGNPTALLKGLAGDLAHAPSNRPHTVPHEFRDAEHVISHLVGVIEQGNLRCLVILDDVWDREIVPLFLRTGLHCLVTSRDVAVVPRHLRGTCTPVDMLTENEALELLKNASQATSSIPRDEGLKVGDFIEKIPFTSDPHAKIVLSRRRPLEAAAV